MKSRLLAIIENYDLDQNRYIAQLEKENEALKEKNAELALQLFSYTQTVDRMKLDLILSGALKKPEPKAV
jgi:hypothetical protein